jgi:hypothetical protein
MSHRFGHAKALTMLIRAEIIWFVRHWPAWPSRVAGEFTDTRRNGAAEQKHLF